MSTRVIVAEPTMTLPEAVRTMKENRVRRLPVVENGKLVGLVSDRDLKEAGPSKATALSVWELHYLLAQTTVSQFMSKRLHSVGPNEPVEKAAQTMNRYRIGGLPVVDNGRLVGVITESDLFRVFARMLGADVGFLKVTLPANEATRERMTRFATMPQMRAMIFDETRPEVDLVFRCPHGMEDVRHMLADIESCGLKPIDWQATEADFDLAPAAM
jgi:CBS domain-containing protein